MRLVHVSEHGVGVEQGLAESHDRLARLNAIGQGFFVAGLPCVALAGAAGSAEAG